LLVDERCELCVEVAFSTGLGDDEFLPERPRRRLRVSRVGLRIGIVGIHQHANLRGRGGELAEELQALRTVRFTRKLTPVRVPPGWLRLATRPALTGSKPLTNTIGVVVVAVLARLETSPPMVTMTATWRRTKSAAKAGIRST